MRKLELKDRILTSSDCFVIAEIGSNHNGDADLCEQMIIAAAKCGADAVKLQKRDNEAMFTKEALARPYENEFSYGKTYGEHRAFLDWFGEKEFLRFKKIAKELGILFFATPFEEKSADFLSKIGVNLWKVASCDVSNLPLVKKIARYGQPMIISTGGHDMASICKMGEAIDQINPNYALLHCISVYPNTDEMLNLRSIMTLRDSFPENLVGFSSHHPGVMPLVIARSLGASIFEVHFTLNRGLRGTDHGFSMEPRGLETTCQDLKRVRVMLGDGLKSVLPQEKNGFVSKMGKGLYLSRPIYKGNKVEREDIAIRAPAIGLRPSDIDRIIGKKMKSDNVAGTPITEEMIYV